MSLESFINVLGSNEPTRIVQHAIIVRDSRRGKEPPAFIGQGLRLRVAVDNDSEAGSIFPSTSDRGPVAAVAWIV